MRPGPGYHSDRARPALVRLATDDPALGALALWCAHRDVPEGPAARTEGQTICYGPGFDHLPPHEQAGLAAHHVLHVALRHGPRMGAMAARLGGRFDEALFGLAADALINTALIAAGHALPRPAVTLPELLRQALGVPAGPEALAEWDVDRLYLQISAQSGGPGKDDDTATRGKAVPQDQPAQRATAYAAAVGFAPDLTRELPDDGNPEGAEEAADWRQHVARAMEAGRLAGRGIGVLGHRIADIAVPRTPWELVLRRLLNRALLPGAQTTHRRPARDWIAAEALARTQGGLVPVFRPGTRRTIDAPRVALAIDASGSIDADLLHRFMAEVAGIARKLAAEITIIAFDDGVQWCQRLDPVRWQAQLASLDWPRGGGTDFAPPLAHAQAMGASVAIVLTDLEGPFGLPPRGLPVIWGATSPAPQPPFGHVLMLDR